MAFQDSYAPGTHIDLRIRQLDLLYEYSRLPQWLILLAAVLISILVWDHVDHTLLLGWLALVLALTLLRNLLTSQYRQSPPEARLKPRWRVLFYLGNALTGFAATYIQIGLVPLETFTLQAPAYSLTTGVSLCVSIIYASRFLAFASFLVPAWLPSIIFLLTRDDSISVYWGVMGVTVFSCILLAGAFINRSVTRTIRADDHNLALVARLEQTHQQAKALNEQLTAEVQHRRRAEQELLESHEALEQRVQQRTAELEDISRALRSSQDRLSLALEVSGLALWDWDLKSDQVEHSKLDTIFGLPPESRPTMLGDLRPHLHLDDVKTVRAALIGHMKDQKAPYRLEYRVKHADGHWLWVEDSGRAVERDATGRVLRMLGTRRDISARKLQEEEALLAATVFEASSEGILILDRQLQVLAVNQAFSVITGYTAGEVIGKVLNILGQSMEPEDYQQLVSTLHSQGRWQGERIATRRNGEQYPQWLQLAVVRDERGRIIHYVAFFADLTVHRQNEEQVTYLTNYDPLTQLANRNLFTQQLNQATGRARTDKRNITLLHLNLDRFKHINDTLGHAVADLLLQQIALRLGEMDQSDLLARLSADEFVILVERQMSRHDLEQLAATLLEEVRSPTLIGAHELVVTASIGISQFPGTARNSLHMIAQANQAMHHAKHLGGNNYQFYTHLLQSYSLDRLQLENQLRKALVDSQLVVHYQPKLDLTTDHVTAAEALVRWQHPQRGLLLPGQFIAMAEETGMIVPLGEIVLRQSCAQASRWYHQGPAPVRIAVNLSVQQLRQENFSRVVLDILEESDLPAQFLELELTESMLLEHLDVVTRNIAELQEMGIRLAVDDFGTGYSSLAYLKRFPLHTLKIDRAFIAELEDGAQDAAIVRAIIAMAHSLGLNVVAEGVELESQLELLRDYGCDEIQGYLISRPLPAQAFARLLTDAQQSLPI
ncbi:MULTISPECIES: bifunctional diguanylate cyclase/phosphodiesterase [Pseudomonas]|uniref:putative bifunctional diguanylate cyclase/phosphodiesterase n=1 Tax=Pseudomonas TaxID=286 RepID=UPI001239CD64|nr:MULTISPECIES: GGDEF domain-containing phosphodiesterase [Pseudomonas]QIB50284.1 EAL domain-containing protein [Pseudomonas sp. OIL-1]